MTISRKNIIFLFCLFICKFSLSQNMTTMGTDFWFTSTIRTDIEWIVDTNRPYNRILLIGPRDCTVTVTCTGTGWDSVFLMPSNTPIDLFSKEFFQRTIQTNLHYSSAVHITSTDSISVYLDLEGCSREIANILPTPRLRSDYIIQTYQSVQGYFFRPSSNFSVLAVEDSTEVALDIIDISLNGDTLEEQNVILLQNAGDCYQVVSSANGNLSGSRITALNGKKIAVFHGNNNASIPCTASWAGGLFEQALPTNYWGRHFFVPNTKTGDGDRVRITALHDDCAISINNQLVTTIASRQTYEYVMDTSSLVDYIETSKKAQVCRYSVIEPPGIIGGSDNPTMLTVMPWELSSEAITTLIPRYWLYPGWPTYQSLDSAYIDIIAKTAEINMIRVDGADISGLFTPVAHNHFFSHARIKMPYGPHSIVSTDGDGFIASQYYIFRYKCYAFPVGSALREMQNSLAINETDMVSWLDTVLVCNGSEVTMSVESLYEPDSVVWYLGDGTHATGQQLSHVFPLSAETYQVMAIVYASCTGCYRQIDTLRGSVKILEKPIQYIDTICCGESYVWQDSTYTEGQQITRHYTDRYGCDSINIMTLHMIPPVTTLVDTISSCDSIFYLGHSYSHDTIIVYDTVASSLGCDSILLRAIDILPSYLTTQDIIIRDTTTLTWIDGNTYSESTDSPYVVLNAHNGCDSVVRLNLNVLPLPPRARIDSSSVWVPNAFTPDEETNNHFILKCNDVTSAQVSIYSRQGIHIYSFNGMTESWDGTIGGKPCPQGTYVYIITYVTVSMPQYKQQKIGTVSIIR